MIDRLCPVCAANTHSPLLAKDSVKLVRCTACTMIFASPVSESYLNGSFYEDAGRPFYLSPEKLSGDYSPVRFTRELSLFREACPSGKVLDVGCSNGAFLFQLGQQFPGAYHLFGTDVSGPARDYAASKGIQTIRCDFLAADFPEANFDAITLWAVLEHVSEPARFVQQAARLLQPGGTCIVLVPNWNSLARRILNARYRYILGQHLNYFDETTLRRMVAGHFAVTRSIYTHFNPFVIKEDFRGAHEPSSAERAQLLQKTNRLKERKNTLLKSAYHAMESILARLHLTDNVALVLRKTARQAKLP
jgi:SAM-dependent methyltransferase